MKKVTFLLAALLCGAVAFADQAPKVVFDFTDTTWGVWNSASYSNDTILTDGVKSIKILSAGYKRYCYNGDSVLFYGKKGATIELPAFDFPVAKIVTVGGKGASAKTTFNIFAGTTAVSTEATNSQLTHTFMIGADYQEIGTVYSLCVTNANNAQVKRIEVYEVIAGAPEMPELSLAEGTYIEEQTLSMSCVTDGAEIYYTTDGTTPDAGSTLYTEEIEVNETMTVRAIAIKNGVASMEVSATYTIVDTEGNGTEEDPFTIADVKKLASSFKGKHWVQGIIAGVYDSKTNKVHTGGFDTDSIMTNIAIAAGLDTIPVQLVSKTEAREVLNLVFHPDNLGKWVKVEGTLEAYFGTTGVKNVAGYELEGGAGVFDAIVDAEKTQKFIYNGRVYILREGALYDALGNMTE